MKQDAIEGAVYGAVIAGAAYTIVQAMGFSSTSLSVILYLFIVSTILVNVKSELATPIKPYLENLVIVAEGEEMKMRKLLTGEKYRVKGDVEKL
ncbi:MAG: hypothetical protein ABEK16_02755 [Candidatus Nanohalobium sp.]